MIHTVRFHHLAILIKEYEINYMKIENFLRTNKFNGLNAFTQADVFNKTSINRTIAGSDKSLIFPVIGVDDECTICSWYQDTCTKYSEGKLVLEDKRAKKDHFPELPADKIITFAEARRQFRKFDHNIYKIPEEVYSINQVHRVV